MRSMVNYGSHLPLLVKVLSITVGDVLELGLGYNSTPVMHWLCAAARRKLVSYENDPKYFEFFRQYERDFHQIQLVENWDKADIDRPWEIAFIDHKPAERRKEDVRRLSNLAQYIIIHDSCGRDDRHYHYSEIYPLFKWRYTYGLYRPHTTVLSNFVDLSEFSV